MDIWQYRVQCNSNVWNDHVLDSKSSITIYMKDDGQKNEGCQMMEKAYMNLWIR